MKIFKKIKDLFKSKPSFLKISKKQKDFKNSVTFEDYNKETIVVSIRISNGIPYLFLNKKGDKFEFAFDKDGASLLSILLSDYIINGNFGYTEETLKGDKND